MNVRDEIPEWDELTEQRRAERAEARRFALHGLPVHESEIVYAEDVASIGKPQPAAVPVDDHLDYCRKVFGGKP